MIASSSGRCWGCAASSSPSSRAARASSAAADSSPGDSSAVFRALKTASLASRSASDSCVGWRVEASGRGACVFVGCLVVGDGGSHGLPCRRTHRSHISTSHKTRQKPPRTRCSAGTALLLPPPLLPPSAAPLLSFLGAAGRALNAIGVGPGAAPDPRRSWPRLSAPLSSLPAVAVRVGERRAWCGRRACTTASSSQSTATLPSTKDSTRPPPAPPHTHTHTHTQAHTHAHTTHAHRHTHNTQAHTRRVLGQLVFRRRAQPQHTPAARAHGARACAHDTAWRGDDAFCGWCAGCGSGSAAPCSRRQRSTHLSPPDRNVSPAALPPVTAPAWLL
jgi:hypothetical protein